MDFLKPLLSSTNQESYGNLGSSNVELSIQVATIEDHGSVSSLSQASVQSQTQLSALFLMPLHKKKTLPYERTTVDSLQAASQNQSLAKLDKIQLQDGPTSTQSLQVSQTSLTFSQKPILKSLPFFPQLSSNKSIKLSSNLEEKSMEKVEVVKKSRYWELLQECQKNNKSFTDTEFPPTDSSMGRPDYIKKQKGFAGWKRISDLVPNSVFVDNFSVEDAIQGSISNCYLISSIAAVAKDYPYMFDRIFVSNKINPYGIYMARLYAEGIVVEVVVDDYVPVSTQMKPYYAKPSVQRQIWVMVLEKCWAKLFSSYQRTDFGRPQQAFYALTGSPLGIKSLQSMRHLTPDLQFLKLYKFQQKGSVFGTFTPKFQTKDAALGLVELHAYSILQIIVNPIYIVKLRNPTAKNSYTKNWKNDLIIQHGNQKALTYLDILRQKGHDLEAPLKEGIFYMDYLEYMSRFDSITFCQIRNEYNLLSTRCTFTKNKGKFFSFILNHQSSIVVSLSQMFRKINQNYQTENKAYNITKLVLARVSQCRNYLLRNSSEKQASSSDNVSIKISGSESQKSKQHQSSQSSQSSESKIHEKASPEYEFVGARSNLEYTAFNFLIFTDSDLGQEKQKVLPPGQYVIYAFANLQKIPKKDFTITVHNHDSCFPKPIDDYAQLFDEKTNPFNSMLDKIGFGDRNEKIEKKWFESVFLNKARSDSSRIKRLNDYEMAKKLMTEEIAKGVKLGQKKQFVNGTVSLEESWFSCRIPWMPQSQKMAGFGYFACHIAENHNSIENFQFSLSDYYGRYIQMVSTDEQFSGKEQKYRMSIKPGETKIVVLRLSVDRQNTADMMKRYKVNGDMSAPAPMPNRFSTPLIGVKKS